MISDKTALILIDVQDGFLDITHWGGRRNNPDAEANMARLLAHWREQHRPIFHVQHMSTFPNSPLRPNQAGNAIQKIVAPIGDEPIIQKTVNSAFIGTDLEARLREQRIDSVVIVGLITNHCVETTARMAGNLGFVTLVVDDATATFDRTGHDGTRYPAETIHALSLANLHDEFATIVTTNQLL
jgi:nicotinamidase-related amidase